MGSFWDRKCCCPCGDAEMATMIAVEDGTVVAEILRQEEFKVAGILQSYIIISCPLYSAFVAFFFCHLLRTDFCISGVIAS
jgi:hypothetical protein